MASSLMSNGQNIRGNLLNNMNFIHFGVDRGMRGYFAVVYDNNGPIQTGIGSYETYLEALEEAIEWAESENFNVEADRLHKRYVDELHKIK